jgi:hypothetical protein
MRVCGLTATDSRLCVLCPCAYMWSVCARAMCDCGVCMRVCLFVCGCCGGVVSRCAGPAAL